MVGSLLFLVSYYCWKACVMETRGEEHEVKKKNWTPNEKLQKDVESFLDLGPPVSSTPRKTTKIKTATKNLPL